MVHGAASGFRGTQKEIMHNLSTGQEEAAAGVDNFAMI